MESAFVKDYIFSADGGYLFCVIDDNVEGGVGPRTTNIASQNVDCCIDGGDFVSSLSMDYTNMIHSKKEMSSSLLSLRMEDQFIDVGDSIGIVGITRTHISPQHFNFSIDRHDGGFRHISIITNLPPWNYLEVGINQLVLPVLICLVLPQEMIKVVWVIEPPILPPKKLIVVLMVVILYHIGGVIIFP